MREVAPGDLIFSFAGHPKSSPSELQEFLLLGKVPSQKSLEMLARTGKYIGWKVKVSFHRACNKVGPKDHIEILRPLLPVDIRPPSQMETEFSRSI